MPDKKEPQVKPISFEHLGARKVGHPVPVKAEQELDFGAIGGKVVRRASDRPIFNVKPESKEDDNN